MENFTKHDQQLDQYHVVFKEAFTCLDVSNLIVGLLYMRDGLKDHPEYRETFEKTLRKVRNYAIIECVSKV